MHTVDTRVCELVGVGVHSKGKFTKSSCFVFRRTQMSNKTLAFRQSRIHMETRTCKMASAESMQLEEKQMRLQEELGSFPRIFIEKFRNWGRNQSALVLAVKPKSLVDIQKVIRAAKKLQLRIRCVGSSHSWSPLFSDEGHICMYMGGLQPDNGHPKIKLNLDSMTVTMLANTTSGELAKFQMDNDVCLMSNVTLESVHVAGLVAVGCHGAAKDEPCVSDYVTEIKVVDSNGDLVTYDDSDPEVFRAVQCHLGLFGVVYEITLKVKPMTLIDTVSSFPRAQDCLLDPEKLQKLARENWCTEIFWFPFNSMSYPGTLITRVSNRILHWKPAFDQCWVRTMNKVTVPSQALPRDEDYLMKKGIAFAENGYIRMFTKYLVEHPSNVPGFLKAGITKILMPLKDLKVCEKLPMGIHYDSWVDLCPTTGVEFVFDVSDVYEDYDLASKACQTVMDVVHSFGRRGKFPVNITMQVRWTGKSNCYMSPAAHKEGDSSTHAFYVCIVSVTGTPSWQEFVNEVARRFVTLSKQPHVHWAKQWGNIPWINTTYLRKIYKDNLSKFRKALEKSGADPTGMFHNEKLEELVFRDDIEDESVDDSFEHFTAEELTKSSLDEQDAVDGGDLAMGAFNHQISSGPDWQIMCEHFAENYMSLRKSKLGDSDVAGHDSYYQSTLQRLAEI